MGFLKDYTFYQSGNHCPELFHFWSGMSLLSACAGHKIWFDQDYFKVRCNVFVVLVGDPGSGKSIAQDGVREIMIEHFPDYQLSETIQSREDIAKKMAAPNCTLFWRDKSKPSTDPAAMVEHHPYFAIVDEFEAFLSVDQTKMVQMLTVLHSGRHFGTGFKTAEAQKRFPNPYFCIHACAQDEWLMSDLRIELFRGGLGRRLILVPAKRKRKIAHPRVPEGGFAALARCVEHLKALSQETVQGNFVMTPEADAWWVKWFESDFEDKTDPILKQFDSTKGVMVLKVAMLLALDERPFRLYIEKHHLEAALAALDLLVPEVKRLTSGIGKNEYGGVVVEVIEAIDAAGGAMLETEMKQRFLRRLPNSSNPMFALQALVNHMVQNQLLFMETPDNVRRVLFTPSRHKKFVENGRKL